MFDEGCGQPPLTAALAALRAAADEVLDHARSRAWSLAPAERVAAIEQLAQARRVADAGHLALVASLDEADAGALGARSVAALLAWRLNVPHGRARADAAAARAVDPERGDLPALGAALAAGAVSTAHVDVAVRALDRLPAALRREHSGAVDAFLAQQSATFRPEECEHLAALVLERIDPDADRRGFDPDAFARRHLTLSPDATGMVLVRGQLDPVAGARLIAALDHLAAPAPATRAGTGAGRTGGADGGRSAGGDGRGGGGDDGGGDDHGQARVRVRDQRTPGQRRADALGTLATHGAAAARAGTRGGEPPRTLVHATLDQLLERPGAGRAVCEQTGPVGAAALRGLKDDAVVQAVLLAPSGAVLSLGRSVRCFTPAQRRTLLVRDGGCVIPGCDAPSGWLEGHHVVDWAVGGLTDVDNAVLACGPHHTAIALGTWAVRMIDGVPQVRPPRWADPERRWVRPPRRDAEESARRLGRQLALDTGPTTAPTHAAVTAGSAAAGTGSTPSGASPAPAEHDPP